MTTDLNRGLRTALRGLHVKTAMSMPLKSQLAQGAVPAVFTGAGTYLATEDPTISGAAALGAGTLGFMARRMETNALQRKLKNLTPRLEELKQPIEGGAERINKAVAAIQGAKGKVLPPEESRALAVEYAAAVDEYNKWKPRIPEYQKLKDQYAQANKDLNSWWG